jgi:glutathione S-transferase
MAPAPKLYYDPCSGNCYKVRLLAGLLDIKLDLVSLDFWAKQHKEANFLKISPKGEIPALVDGDKIFTDSAAILVYLAGTYPDEGSSQTPSSYWSADVVEQAQIVDWLAFAATYIQTSLSPARAAVAFKHFPPNANEAHLKGWQEKSDKALKILEEKLSKDLWLAAGRPTVADVACFVYVALSHMGNVSLEPFPVVRAWIKRVQGLPGYVPLTGGVEKARH